jgi:SET domain-containing protein
MLIVRTYVAPSPIHGMGCFAAEPIKGGQLVWQFDPRLDLRIPLAEFSNFPTAAQEFLKRLTYTETLAGVDYLVLCADQAKFVNHSDTPNLVDSQDGLQEWAAYDIAAGQELTCNYFLSDQQAAEKLGGESA